MKKTLNFSFAAMFSVRLSALLFAVMSVGSLLSTITSCAPDSVAPDPIQNPGEGEGGGSRTAQTVSIAFLKTLYSGAPTLVRGEYIVEGRVVSGDSQGNFYKTLVIQDETGGIELRLDMEDISERFKLYSTVIVRCNGLWLGTYGDVLQLGAEPFDTYETQPLDEASVAEHILGLDVVQGEVLPHLTTFSELTPRYISTRVMFRNVKFVEAESDLCWTDEGLDTDRHLIDAKGDTLIVRTSHHAKFALEMLPDDELCIHGILRCFNGEYQLVVNSHINVIPEIHMPD